MVGRVLTCEPHPDADRLSVCTVDTGDGEPRTIVCGAPNVAAGQTVAGGAARGRRCRRREARRGEAPRRQVLGDDPLRRRARDRRGRRRDHGARRRRRCPGRALAEALPLAEPVLELEVTPNRVDCFGVYGVAREVHAVTAAPLGPEPWEEDAPAEGEGEAERPRLGRRSRSPSSARASLRASSPTSRSGPRRPGCRRG